MGSKAFDISPIRRALKSAWQKRQEDEAGRCTSGSDCLRVFEARSMQRGKANEQVSQRDREKIAYALNLEIERLENRPDLARRAFSRSALMIESGLAKANDPRPTKRLWELTIDPTQDEKRLKKRLDPRQFEERLKKRLDCLNKGYWKYLQLIKGILAFTKEDADAVSARIFAGTSFCGIETDVNRNRQLARRLKESVEHINSLVGQCGPRRTLEQLFEASASHKEQAQRAGDVRNWPFFDSDSPYWSNDNELPNWESPYWGNFNWRLAVPSHFIQSGGDSARVKTCLGWEDAVIFLPRTYLGCAICFEDWRVEAVDHAQYLDAHLQVQAQIAEVRCLDHGGHSIQYRGAEGRYAPRPRADPDFDGVGQCWLVIYPAPDGRGLCPMLYWCQGEGGVHVCVLDDESIDILSTFHVWNADTQVVESLFDRIHRLAIGDACQLEVEWMRTAFDLLENPFLSRRPAAPKSPTGQCAN